MERLALLACEEEAHSIQYERTRLTVAYKDQKGIVAQRSLIGRLDKSETRYELVNDQNTSRHSAMPPVPGLGKDVSTENRLFCRR